MRSMWSEKFEEPDCVIATDATLLAAGGICQQQFFRVLFPEHVTLGASIASLEMWALIIGIKIWASQLAHKAVVVYCDNQAVAQVINTGRARDVRLQEGLREICYLAAGAECEIFARFIPGTENRLPDYLSRWHQGHQYRVAFRQLAPAFVCRPVRRSLFYYSHSW